MEREDGREREEARRRMRGWLAFSEKLDRMIEQAEALHDADAIVAEARRREAQEAEHVPAHGEKRR